MVLVICVCLYDNIHNSCKVQNTKKLLNLVLERLEIRSWHSFDRALLALAVANLAGKLSPKALAQQTILKLVKGKGVQVCCEV